jgi:transmembrane sensor
MGRERGIDSEAVNEAAARWVVRLTGGLYTQRDRALFEAWRDQSLAHEVAYERARAAWNRLDRLTALQQSGDYMPDLLAANATAPPARQFKTGRRWLGAASVAAALLIGSFTFMGLTSPAYATAIGERRLVVLSDGTRVELNTDSKIVVRYRHARREISLVRGEALFEINADPRGFVIRIPHGRLVANQSQVLVRLRSADATVTVKSGAVEVETSASGTEMVVADLKPGQASAIGSREGQPRAVAQGEIDRMLAWREGAIALDGQTLGEAAGEFNRYNAKHILIVDDATSRLRLGGYFRTDDLNGFVAAVVKTFPVKATRTSADEIVLSRKTTPAI